MSLAKQYRRYTPDSPLKHPRQFWREMVADFRLAGGLAWQLTMRDFKAQYRQSFMGYAWAILPPFIASFTFILLRSSGAVRIGETSIPYAAYAIIGTLLWQVFADSLMQPIRIMGSCRQMLMKINFPRESLLISAIQFSLINLCIRLCILVPVLLYFQITPGIELLYAAPIGIIFIVLLGNSIGVFLAPLAGLYKDIQQGLMVIMTFWMLFTPVVFTGASKGLGGFIIKLNPVTHILPATRNWLTGQTVGPAELQSFALVVAATLALLTFGWLSYRVVLPRVIERLGM
jgi:lipopolysaccharide transport system permease protein